MIAKITRTAQQQEMDKYVVKGFTRIAPRHSVHEKYFPHTWFEMPDYVLRMKPESFSSGYFIKTSLEAQLGVFVEHDECGASCSIVTADQDVFPQPGFVHGTQWTGHLLFSCVDLYQCVALPGKPTKLAFSAPLGKYS